MGCLLLPVSCVHEGFAVIAAGQPGEDVAGFWHLAGRAGVA